MSNALIVTCKCPKSMSSQKMSPLGTCTQARADFAVSSSGALVQLEEKNCFSCLPKYEEVQEPVGGGAVDVDHVADFAFTISCLLPETHDVSWC